MKIMQLEFKKKDEETSLKDSKNLELIDKYILPIIAENEGWGSKVLTKESFKKNPSAFQEEITNSTCNNVHIALDESENPIALLFFDKDMLNVGKYQSLPILREMLSDSSSKLWDIAYKTSNSDIKYETSELYEYLSKMPLYHEIGITIAPRFQGRSSGSYEALTSVMKDGINFAWTSNPIVILKHRKIFKTLLVYPLLGEKIDSFVKFALHLHIVADIASYEESRTKPYPFGVIQSEYFVMERGREYVELAKNLEKSGKLSSIDVKRLKYSLGGKSVAGAFIGIN